MLAQKMWLYSSSFEDSCSNYPKGDRNVWAGRLLNMLEPRANLIVLSYYNTTYMNSQCFPLPPDMSHVNDRSTDGVDFVRGYPFSLREGIPTACLMVV
ncbi:hypothetical protein L6452_08134 [Arctium lappa]|uniref:Uncharacterized protein n=1 Tax=Arctium lappa TaxID=4217 RepID=A0ACB9DH92_ARCLA|nr:hypothetical protein L6452_08134 [Arctium lappa]